jgi:hypothetical protein
MNLFKAGIIHKIRLSDCKSVKDESGIVLFAVLVFVAMLLPVTLVILNTIQIETLMPTNESYGKIASHEADKGFDVAMAALVADNEDGFVATIQGQQQGVVCIADPTRPIPDSFDTMQPNQPYYVPGMARGRHDIDYLAESWARHPDNYTYFLAEHSRENEVNAIFNPDPPDDPDIYTVPTRWIMMNVPFGMDDHGERAYDGNDNSNILTNIDGGDITPVDAYAADTAEDTEFQSAPLYVHGNWWFSPGLPGHPAIEHIARPSSFFRNTNPAAASTLNKYNDNVVDALVYDARLDDIDENGTWGEDDRNQYLNNPVLQEAVLDSEWANLYYGEGAASSRNLEYKPLPGSVTQYPIGSTGNEYIPAWFESIVSDEASRFNLNTILNVIYQGANIDYNSDGTDTLAAPIIQFDDYGYDFLPVDDVMGDEEHPNYSNFLLAQDMVAALLVGDSVTQPDFDAARQKAAWVLRNMLTVRERLDAYNDGDGDGTADETFVPVGGGNPNTDINNREQTLYDGRGRMGDATRNNQGTWQIYKNPKDFLNDPALYGYVDFPNFRPLTQFDFQSLNEKCTVYTYETEHTADIQSSAAFDDPMGYRIFFNGVDETDDYLEDLLRSEIGNERYRSLFRWRDGLVDLNNDGDLSDEYVLQPVRDPERAEAATLLTDDSQPVSQINYRERNHPNFQNPSNPEYPSMLNVPDLGSLITIPMSIRGTQIVASMSGVMLGKYDPNTTAPGVPIVDTDDGLVSDIDFTGTNMVFDSLPDLDNIFAINPLNSANLVQFVTPVGYHPSYSPDGQQFVFVDKSAGPTNPVLSIYDILTDTIVRTNINGFVPLAQITYPPPAPPGDFNESPAPDWSPSGQGDIIAFSGGGVFDYNDPLADHIDIYTVRLSGGGAGLPDNVTNLSDGRYALYPDFSPDGQWLAYTLIDINEIFRPNPRPFKLVIQNLVNNQRTEIPRRGGPDIIDPGTGRILGIELMPLAPDWDPYGNKFCFMGLPLFLGPGGATVGIPDIYTISRGATDLANITNTPGEAELYPCWGWGNTVVSHQNPMDAGNARGSAVTYPDWNVLGIDPNDTRDEDFRKELANAIQHASIAFRMDLEAGTDQDWRFMDLPYVPINVTESLGNIADTICFRSPYSPRFATDQITDNFPQAYPGQVNINTAPPEVLRALFLLMFQGAVYDWNDDTGVHGSSPYVRATMMSPEPINLACQDTTPQQRYTALCIADVYAHQVDEYRRWIYNNQSKSFNTPCYNGNTNTFSITRETVPDNLIYPISGGNTGQNYRANPFAPWDLDNDQNTQDRPLYDPEPPFRNIADLFKVTLYNGTADYDWLLEGFAADYGPDEEEEINSEYVIPLAYKFDDPTDPANSDITLANFGDPIIGPNALAVWGPIYQTDFHITNGLAAGDDYQLDTYITPANGNTTPGTLYYNQQRFRLFSADDFKWISPYITTRSYVYRVESRGTVRVASGSQKLDISRDKLWVVDFGLDANLNFDTTGDDQLNLRKTINGNEFAPYVVREFEEVPVDGIPVTRKEFTPPKF